MMIQTLEWKACPRQAVKIESLPASRFTVRPRSVQMHASATDSKKHVVKFGDQTLSTQRLINYLQYIRKSHGITAGVSCQVHLEARHSSSPMIWVGCAPDTANTLWALTPPQSVATKRNPPATSWPNLMTDMVNKADQFNLHWLTTTTK